MASPVALAIALAGALLTLLALLALHGAGNWHASESLSLDDANANCGMHHGQ